MGEPPKSSQSEEKGGGEERAEKWGRSFQRARVLGEVGESNP